MEVSLLRVADYALVSNDGKLSVIGLFDNINAHAFPVVHPSMTLVVEFRARSSEFNREFPVEIQLVDEDGQTVFGANINLNVSGPPGLPVVNVPQIFNLQMAKFDRPGVYEFSVFVNNDLKASYPFTVIQLQPAH